ncbi:hypothetical protein K431DRAFT_333667 [Polychaeton citri CBS 116435]|uniref:Uncharacterized protein n=1 Tax=Polychaeton citri CBS 116435 TaxID=1314669 RepID=A0A9P4UME5_9PEZI|nr:hypothetical protein K431DRAFT_333667 [Polychaeton citri CBS 116435]
MSSYPGLGLDLRYHDQNHSHSRGGDIYPMGIHPNCFGSNSAMLMVREVAMMIVMDRLTDKPDWHVKVFDDAIVKKWGDEALALPTQQLYEDIVKGKDHRNQEPEDLRTRLKSILDQSCVDYCIQELRAKAKFFEKTGLIPTLDASATICKSDTVVDDSLRNALRAAASKLQDEQASNPDWHPRTNDKVQDLVHPSLYPLVYGETRVFDDEVVGVEDAIPKWAGKGTVIPEQEDTPKTQAWHRFQIGGSDIEPSFWSSKYQWLPSNVKLQEDGKVKITSYINNLHPQKHSETYATVERLIEEALPAWDFCVAQYRSYKHVSGGRTEPRFPFPDNADDENPENWTPSFDEYKARNPDEEDEVEEQDEYGNYYNGTRQEVDWCLHREPVQPEAPDFEAWGYTTKPADSLSKRFKDLQVIVKIASIELTPDKPDFPAGGWHVEGQMNEHIVGTALYYLDSENVTPSHLHFRMQTSSYQDEDYTVGQDSYKWLQMVYGTQLGSGSGGPCLQNYGSVETRQGRLLAFPNVYHHRVSPFELQDKTKPGHRRFIALWLVDPLTRIISTANVPPQQQGWWLEQAFQHLRPENADRVPQPVAQLISERFPEHGHPGLKAAENKQSEQALPPELMEMIDEQYSDATMSLKEAKEHRLKLMDERTAFQDQAVDDWLHVTYSFCEH